MANSYRLFSKFCKVATTLAGSTTTPAAGGTPNVQHTTGASNPAGAQSTTPQPGQTGNAQQAQNNITFRGNHTVNADLSNVDWRNRATSENSTTNIGGMWLHDKDVAAFTGMRDQLQQSYVNRGFSAADARLKASQRTAQYWDDQYRLASGGKARNEWQSKPRVAKQPAATPAATPAVAPAATPAVTPEVPAEQPAATPEVPVEQPAATTPAGQSADQEDWKDLNAKFKADNAANAEKAKTQQADQGAVAAYNAKAMERIRNGEDPETVLRDVAYGDIDTIRKQYGYSEDDLKPAVDANGNKIPGVFITTKDHRYVGWNGDHLVSIKTPDGRQFLSNAAGEGNYIARDPWYRKGDLSQYQSEMLKGMYPRAAAVLGFSRKDGSGEYDRLYSNNEGMTLDLYNKKLLDNDAAPVEPFGRSFYAPIEHTPGIGLGGRRTMHSNPFVWGDVIEYPEQQQ